MKSVIHLEDTIKSNQKLNNALRSKTKGKNLLIQETAAREAQHIKESLDPLVCSAPLSIPDIQFQKLIKVSSALAHFQKK